MVIVTILLFLALFSFISLVRMIINVRSVNPMEEGEEGTTIITTSGVDRKISPKVGKYVDFKENK